MIEVADVVRRFGPSYLKVHGASVLPSHRHALDDIVACRTELLGGLLWRCSSCSAELPSYHGCRNRSCPKCHKDQTQAWLAARKNEVLPTSHFHVTITIPAELRDLFRRNQCDCYGLLMGAAGAAITELARDPRYVGGTVGVLAVLHTWTQRLDFHPHVHCLVTGGGISADRTTWHPCVRDDFLVPVKALAKIVRGKVRAGLPPALTAAVLARVWEVPWVVHCVRWGEGEQAVLEYLARYVFRTAITNSRIVAMDDKTVTFTYKKRDEGTAGQRRTCTLSGHEFLRRFCQHVLPRGFHKVRYYGLWHPSNRDVAKRVRVMLLLDRKTPPVAPPKGTPDDAPVAPEAEDGSERHPAAPRCCPRCGKTHFLFIGRLTPTRYRVPPQRSPTP